MSPALTQITLRRESAPYAGTCGDSGTACRNRFQPAFRDADGRVELARLADGRPAPMHLIATLPAVWANLFDASGNIIQLKAGIVAGFVRDDRFYTREEAAAAG